MAKNNKNYAEKGKSTSDITIDKGTPTPGIINGKLGEEENRAFQAVGWSLNRGFTPKQHNWSLLSVGMKNYYRERYPSFNLYF